MLMRITRQNVMSMWSRNNEGLSDYVERPLLDQMWAGLDEVLLHAEYAGLARLQVKLADANPSLAPCLEASVRVSMPMLHERDMLVVSVSR
jgi:hypothetical protein